jgi:hypothetical protein
MVMVSNDILDKYTNTAALSLFKQKDIKLFRQVLDKLSKSAITTYCGSHVSNDFAKFIHERSTEVSNLKVGDFLLWCGGWSGTDGGHAIMYMVDRTSNDEISFVVLNTGQGVGYVIVGRCFFLFLFLFLFLFSFQSHGLTLFVDIIQVFLLKNRSVTRKCV